jgi:hypothetical protein
MFDIGTRRHIDAPADGRRHLRSDDLQGESLRLDQDARPEVRRQQETRHHQVSN